AASGRDRQFGLVLAAQSRRPSALTRVIEVGMDLNGPSPDLYPDATALHAAVGSGALEAVKVLVEAGANLSTRDTAWNGPPLDWAEHYRSGHQRDKRGRQYAEIAAYLRRKGAMDD